MKKVPFSKKIQNVKNEKNVQKLNQSTLSNEDEVKIKDNDKNSQFLNDFENKNNRKNSEKNEYSSASTSYPIERPNIIESKENTILKPQLLKPFDNPINVKSENDSLHNITIKLKEINNVDNNNSLTEDSTNHKEISIPNQKLQYYSNTIQQKISQKNTHVECESNYTNEKFYVDEVAEESEPALFNEETFIYIDKNAKNCNVLGKGLYVSSFKN